MSRKRKPEPVLLVVGMDEIVRYADSKVVGMTSLQLARALVAAVMSPERSTTAEVALLQALETHGAWFCKLSEDEAGLTVEEPYAKS
jgi:hypothetical protein